MKKIRILLIGMSSNLGGIETYIYNLIKNADLNKFHFDILASTSQKIALNSEMERFNCNVFYISPRDRNMISHYKELRDFFRNADYDILHCNIMSYSWFEPIIFANYYSNIKIIIHSHNGRFDKSIGLKTKVFHQLGDVLLKFVPYTRVACSKQAGILMFRKHKFEIFNNGIDVNKFSFNEKNRILIRNELDIENNVFLIGLIAAFLEVKNHCFLINMFKEYAALNKNSKLVLVGDGPILDDMKRLVIKYNLENKVLFLGKRKDVDKIYSALDCFVMPSFSEGFGISLCEAQTNGLICYASDGVDINANITGNVKFISLSRTPKEWAEIIYRSNNSRDKKAITKIPDKFISKKSYEKVYSYYEKIVGDSNDRHKKNTKKNGFK